MKTVFQILLTILWVSGSAQAQWDNDNGDSILARPPTRMPRPQRPERPDRPVRPDPSDRSRRLISCASFSGGRKECYVGQGIVRLDRQMSNVACVQNTNWGYDVRKGVIWVNRGCRAEFGFTARVLNSAVVRCESTGGRYTRCENRGVIVHAELTQQISKSRCQIGVGWGYDTRGIWVDKGCRGNFRVTTY